ncbi:MAG: alpha/beta fold hydrolase [Patescibacteria group bacterium]|nr:alpha/beta fold hydrolase [Patescibacteria group bacterium]
MEKISLTTKDNKSISGNFFPAENARGWVIYLHMMPSAKESWNRIAGRLARDGYSGLAIDLRGHGESEGGPNGYKYFSDAEHQASINDVEAAFDFLLSKGARAGHIRLIGASIGANLAIEFFSKHKEFPSAVFLSAGTNYRGVSALRAAENLSPGQSALFLTSRDDLGADGSNPEQNEAIISSLPSGVKAEKVIYNSAGHGTNILQTKEDPDPEELIVSFIER